MERITAGELFDYLKIRDPNIKLYGRKDKEIVGFSSLDNYKKGSITWLKKQADTNLRRHNLTAVVCSPDVEIAAEVRIVTDNPKDIFFAAAEYLDESVTVSGIAPTAILGNDVKIGENVLIGDYCCIGDNVQIGDETIIGAHVVIHKNVKIGKRCAVKPGAVIGGAGYGYSKRDHKHYKIRHYGSVVIGDDVDIGSNTCIDCGTIDDTVIGNGVKIDNLCHIAHNVIIGNNSSIVANSTICGSTVIGCEVYIAPNSVIMNQIKVGDGALVGMGAVVTKNIAEDTVNIGFPAEKIRIRTDEDWRKY